MYFSGSAVTAPILFGGGWAERLTEDQVQGHAEDGQYDPGGPKREGGATREVTTTPEHPDEKEKRAQHRQPVGGPAAPGQFRREDAAQTGDKNQADQGEGREQRVCGSGVELRHSSSAAIGPPPLTRSPSSEA